MTYLGSGEDVLERYIYTVLCGTIPPRAHSRRKNPIHYMIMGWLVNFQSPGLANVFPELKKGVKHI